MEVYQWGPRLIYSMGPTLPPVGEEWTVLKFSTDGKHQTLYSYEVGTYAECKRYADKAVTDYYWKFKVVRAQIEGRK